MFRKGILDIGGLKMLRDLLKTKDAAVRKEAAPAVLAIFPFDRGDPLIESPMVKDEIMILLDNLPKGPHVLSVIRDHEVQLVNIIMDGQNLGLLSCEGFCSAISLIKTIAQRNVGITSKVKNLKDFRLSKKPNEHIVKWKENDVSRRILLASVIRLLFCLFLHIYLMKSQTEMQFPLYAEVTFGCLICTSKLVRFC
jgi:hypothetical protein